MRPTVLLTGATGFVGRQVLKALMSQAVSVRLVVRNGDQLKNDHLFQSAEVVSTNDMFAESQNWWQEICEGIDTVIHVAWYAKPGKYLYSQKNMNSLSGTLTLSRACAQSGVRRFVGVGTCFEYDLSQGYLSVNTPLLPSTPYAASKAAAYLALNHYFPLVGVEFAWCRLFYLYGEGENQRRLVPYVRAQLEAGKPAELTSGNQVRDFLDVEEAGRMIVRVAIGEHTGPVNICSAMPVTVRELVENIADEYGRRDLLFFGSRSENSIDPACVVGIKEYL